MVESDFLKTVCVILKRFPENAAFLPQTLHIFSV